MNRIEVIGDNMDLKIKIISLVSIAKLHCTEEWSKEFENVGIELASKLDELQELKDKQRGLISIY